MLSPKESGKLIASKAKHVVILEKGVKQLAQEVMKQLDEGKIKMGDMWEIEFNGFSNENIVDWVLLTNTINYCFWTPGSLKWVVSYKGKKLSGSFGLFAAIFRALDEGIDIINPKVYSELTLADITNIFRSSTTREIPLLNERLECLHQVGNVLLEKYEGTFVNCVKACNRSAQALINVLISSFECFNDKAVYEEQEVSFLKRAQLVVAHLWTYFGGEDYGNFEDIDTITMFADYRVPQTLAHFGVLTYSRELMELLNADEILTAGSEFELEIRGCSIEAVERIKARVDKLMAEQNKKYLCNSILIDNFLWLYRRKHARKVKTPFHKVLTIFY